MNVKSSWRIWLLCFLTLGSLIWTMSQPVMPQSQAYHRFADDRVFLGIPHAGDVLTNLALLVPGLLGLSLCLRARLPGARRSWQVQFAGISLVTLGSGYYHWRPDNWTLLWDRLPMTVSFMGLFSALLCEYVFSDDSEDIILAPFLIGGLSSAVYWYFFDDLRPYLWVQFFPLACILVIPFLFQPRYPGRGYLVVGLALYAFAKWTEVNDPRIYQATGMIISGHSIKHLLAAAANLMLALMIGLRSARDSVGAGGQEPPNPS